MKIKELYDNPYDFARSKMNKNATDREKSIFLDAIIANWEDIKEENIENLSI